MTAPGIAAGVIRSTRAQVVAEELLGTEPNGVTVCDRYAGYKFIGLERRQVCLAHIRRDFVWMSEGETAFRSLGFRLLGLLDELFRLWHMFQPHEIERHQMRRWSRHLRKRVLALLVEGATSRGYYTPGLCRGILESAPAMWTFVVVEGVPPTNNDAERAIRPVGLALRLPWIPLTWSHVRPRLRAVADMLASFSQSMTTHSNWAVKRAYPSAQGTSIRCIPCSAQEARGTLQTIQVW